MARWKRWAKELAVMAVVTTVVMSVVGFFRAPSYDDARLPVVRTMTLDGSVFDTAEAPKEPYVLHFWATWCPTCRAEAGNIDAVAKSAPVVTVAVRSGSDGKVKNYLRENDLAFAVVNDEEGVLASRFKVGVFPTTIIVGKDGKLFWAESGYTTTWGLKLRLWLADNF